MTTGTTQPLHEVGTPTAPASAPTTATAALELEDIQRGVLRMRPMPYVATALLLRIDNPVAGRSALSRLLPWIAAATDLSSRAGAALVSVALSYQGLQALGVPQPSLDSFPLEFCQGMAGRAGDLGDVDSNAPTNWEPPLGTPQVHLALTAVAPDQASLRAVLAPARQALQGMPELALLYRQECASPPSGREHFGFRDGIGQPAIEGIVTPGSNPQEAPLKAGEFVLGYPDESGAMPPMPQPSVLGRNGSYVAFRKLHQNVAAFRKFLAQKSSSPSESELLAAKMVGRWRSGAPLSLAPEHDDPELGADVDRRNDFLYYDDDPKGLKCPLGSHIRRMNPRDQFKHELVDVRRHRVLRRGLAYGPALPEGVLEDDGADRGVLFLFLGADLGRQFEFVQTEWIDQGTFIGAPAEKDPVIGPNDGTGIFTIPQQPIRRRLQGLPQFVTVRGGEYFFLPGLRALRWLAEGVYGAEGHDTSVP